MTWYCFLLHCWCYCIPHSHHLLGEVGQRVCLFVLTEILSDPFVEYFPNLTDGTEGGCWKWKVFIFWPNTSSRVKWGVRSIWKLWRGGEQQWNSSTQESERCHCCVVPSLAAPSPGSLAFLVPPWLLAYVLPILAPFWMLLVRILINLARSWSLVRNTPGGLNVFTKFHPATTNKLQEKHLKYCPDNFRSKFYIWYK